MNEKVQVERAQTFLTFAKSKPMGEMYEYCNTADCPVQQLRKFEGTFSHSWQDAPCQEEIVEEFGETIYLAINPDNYRQHRGEPGYEQTWGALVRRLESQS